MNKISQLSTAPMSQINISPSGENLTIEQVMQYQVLIEEGYLYAIQEIVLEADILDDLRNELNKKYNIKEYDYKSISRSYEIWKCNEFNMDVVWDSDNIYLNVFCKTQEINAELFQILVKYESDSNTIDLFMDNYYINNNHLDTHLKIYKKNDFSYANKLYYPYIKTDIMFKQLFTNKENILILCGIPGTGKTSLTSQLMKYSLENVDILPYKKSLDISERFIKVAYIKSTEILAMDEFWRTLSSKQYDIVILDDLDYFLTARDQEIQTGEDVERNKFLSQFLSFTDGIEQNKTKFVITTNQTFKDIDSALLRKGRLFDILELRELTNKEALNIWLDAGLPKKLFMFEGAVLQADLGSEIEKHLNEDVKIEKYLTDKSISKIKKFTKKIGF